MVTFTVTFATITLRVVGLVLLFYTSKPKKPGKWDTSAKVTRPRGGRAGFQAQRAPASRRPTSRADSWQVFRDPLGDHLSNSVAGLPSLPPSCLIQISLPTRSLFTFCLSPDQCEAEQTGMEERRLGLSRCTSLNLIRVPSNAKPSAAAKCVTAEKEAQSISSETRLGSHFLHTSCVPLGKWLNLCVLIS